MTRPSRTITHPTEGLGLLWGRPRSASRAAAASQRASSVGGLVNRSARRLFDALALGSLFAGVAWRPESALADAAWAGGPVAAHSVFFISAVLAFNLEPAESADEGRKGD